MAPRGALYTVFFAFWLSHVPPARFEQFWTTIRSALSSGGQALFVDTGPAEARLEHFIEATPVPLVERTLEDGTHHRVVKVLHEPAALRARLENLGFSAAVWNAPSPPPAVTESLYLGRVTARAVH